MSNIRELPVHEQPVFQTGGAVVRLADAVAAIQEILQKYIADDPLVLGHQSLASIFGNSAFGLLVQGVVMPLQKLRTCAGNLEGTAREQLLASASRVLKKILDAKENPLDNPSQRALPLQAIHLSGTGERVRLAVVRAKTGLTTLEAQCSGAPRLHTAVVRAFGLRDDARLPVPVTPEQVEKASIALSEARKGPAAEGRLEPATHIVLKPASHPGETVGEAIIKACNEIMVRAADIPEINPRDLMQVAINATEAQRAAREIAAFVNACRADAPGAFVGTKKFYAQQGDGAIRAANGGRAMMDMIA